MRFLLDNKRWLFTGFLLAFGSSFGQTWFITLFTPGILADHGLTIGEWGRIYMIATLSSAAVLLSRGGLADTMPLRRLVLIITLIFACATWVMAVAPNVWVLGLAVFMLRFAGQGMFTHMSVTAMGRWFVATRGRAVALASLGYQFGESLLPLAVVGLIAWIGWRESYALMGAVLALGFAPMLFWLLSRDRMPEGAATTDGAVAGLEGRHWTRDEVLRHWLFWALLPLALTPGWIGTVTFFHQAHIAEVKGWSLAQIAAIYPIYAATTVTVSLISGWLCDRFGPERLLPVLLVPMGLSMFLVGPAGAPLVWGMVLAVMGVSQGLINTFWGAFLPRIYGTRHLGSVRSMMTALMVVSSAVGPWATGVAIDWGVNFPAQGVAHGLWCLGLSVMLVVVGLRLNRVMHGATQ